MCAHITSSQGDRQYCTTLHQDWMLLLNLGYNVKISDSGERSARVKRCNSDKIRALVKADVASISSEEEEGKTYSLQLAIMI